MARTRNLMAVGTAACMIMPPAGLLGVAIRRDHLITRVHRVCAAPRWNISKTDMAASLTAH